jgi:hypothetical protein
MSNFDNMDISSLIKMSEESKKLINIEMAKFDKIFEEVKKNVPAEQVGFLEKTKAQMNKAIILAKEGRQEEANEIVNNLKHER